METQFEKVPSNVQEVPGRGETLQAARERLNQTLSGVSEQAKTAAQYADETVHNNPWTSVGVGFGLGVIVGALIAIAAGSRSSRIL
ncbi:MAG TPA: hypothetical protein VGX52_18740 [Burkholderiales bacterium]|nr:hypothetical protein [Burkholderiales bacterium]